MPLKERYAMMRKRHAFLSETVKGYTSLEEYARDKDEWFAIIGIRLTFEGDFVSLAIALNYEEIEEYYVYATDNGKLEVGSDVMVLEKDLPLSVVDDIFDEEGVCSSILCKI